MRTLRAKGEAGEKESFMGKASYGMTGNGFSSLRAKRSNPVCLRGNSLDCFVASLLAMTGRERRSLRRNDLLALLAEAFDAERDDVADIEEGRRLHAEADAG